MRFWYIQRCFQYQAMRQGSDGEHYAVKRMDKDIDRPGTQLMFFREISILLALQYPAVLPFAGFTLPTHDEPHFQIVTKFMRNSNVQQIETELEMSGTMGKPY
jgi:hypothetical protein